MTTPTTQCQATTTKGKQCSRPAVRDGFCTPHNQRFNTAETVELPAMPPALDDFIDDDSEIAAVDIDVPVGPVNPALNAALGPRSTSKRCPAKGCGQLRDHEGNHDGPQRMLSICVARKCRLPLGHPGVHGVPAKERHSIGALTGKL